MEHCNRAKELDQGDPSVTGRKLDEDHSRLDNLITRIFLSLPEHLRFSTARQGPAIAHFNMCLHGASICLHLAAIDRSQKELPHSVISPLDSRRRCRNAVEGILLIIRNMAHLDPAQVSPLLQDSMSLRADPPYPDGPLYLIWTLHGRHCPHQTLRAKRDAHERPCRHQTNHHGYALPRAALENDQDVSRAAAQGPGAVQH